jgi:uncharacterized protein YjbI with pentapeptide repeats
MTKRSRNAGAKHAVDTTFYGLAPAKAGESAVARKFSGAEREAKALEKVVNDAAVSTAAMWLSFLTVATYLALSIGSITHKALLLETPLKMPLFDVSLPLEGFFVGAPLIFFIFHTYLLLQLFSLSQRIAEYNAAMHEQSLSHKRETLARYQLEGFVLVQVLAGPRHKNDSAIRVLLLGIAWTTIVAIPLLVLLLTEFMFLPYRSVPIVWTHRVLIIADAFMVALFWPLICGQAHRLPLAFRKGYLTIAVGCFVAILATFIAIFPGEKFYRYVHTPMTTLLFEGDSNPITGRAESMFSNRLMSPDTVLVKTEDVEHLERAVSFRGRNLRGAVLSGSDLRKADFTGADLTEANLSRANLEHAWFRCADRVQKTGCTHMIGADLSQAHLEEASLEGAILVGASLEAAHLRGASLEEANMAGADLRSARLYKANLQSIGGVHGASFDGAHFDDAAFEIAEFDGAAIIGVTGLPSNASSEGLWTTSDEGVPTNDQKRQELAQRLISYACVEEYAPYVARGMLRNRYLTHTGKFFVLVAKQLKPGGCSGAIGLTQKDLTMLDAQLKASEEIKPM